MLSNQKIKKPKNQYAISIRTVGYRSVQPCYAIRTVGYNYTKPLPTGFERVEENLRGAIYDPLIRKIVWEGVEGKWAEEVGDWVSCSKDEGDMTAEAEEKKDNVWRTLGDFFLPGWFVRRSVEIPITDTEFICPYHWAKPIHLLNCELIWPKQLEGDHSASRVMASSPRRARCKRYPHFDNFDMEEEEDVVETENDEEPPYELDNPDYMGAIEKRMLLEQFLGQGGVRLAAALNYIFGDGSSSVARV